MVDISVDFGRAIYNIETENAQEKTKISSFLKAYQFQEMIDKILHDMVTYGDCFVQTISDKTIILQKLDPTDLEFEIDWINEPPARSYHEAITKIQKHTTPFTKYDVKTILHFKNGSPISSFNGESIFGFWFKDWYFLRDCAEVVPLLGVEGEQYSNVRWFRDFKESNVLGAAGIPHELIFPWMKIDNPRFKQIEANRFQHNIERRREKISRILERKLFPQIVNRDYEYHNFPRLTWRTP
jgi:hypothetical protein